MIDSRPEADSSEALVRELRSDLGRIRDSIQRTLGVEWQRLRLRAVDACFRAAFLACLFSFAVGASLAGALLLALGLREALTLWSGAPWLGNMGAGAALLGFAMGALLASRARYRSDCVREAKRGAP
jgi:hypothetical protein